STAAREIKNLVGESVAQVGLGSQLVDQTGATMGEIVASVRRVTDIMAEIADASRQQTAGIEQVNSAIAQMDRDTEQNASLVEQTAAAASSLHEQAGALAEVVSVFTLDGAARPRPGAPAAVAPMPAGP
ncbi:methyl-accepting chemotaxis protein, partial [Massilia glaciei]